MLIDKTIASKLRALKPGDTIEINGEQLKLISAWETRDSGKLTNQRETRSEGMEFELQGEISSGYTLLLYDVEIEFERVAELRGPAPLNPNPDIVFVQDTELDKTYKYAIKRRQKKDASYRFLKGSDEIEIKSINVL